jgi:hypothetical protein
MELGRKYQMGNSQKKEQVIRSNTCQMGCGRELAGFGTKKSHMTSSWKGLFLQLPLDMMAGVQTKTAHDQSRKAPES